MFLNSNTLLSMYLLCNSRIHVITLYSGYVCMYYASMLQCWHLIWILVRTDHLFKGWDVTVFLAIAIQSIKPVHIKVIITHLCYFFNTVSQKVIGRKELNNLRAYMIETMCMLDMCFPPLFDMQ
jgi:hypothetical protein